MARKRLIVTTGNEVAGRRIVRYLGVVRGIVVRSPGWARSSIQKSLAIPSGNPETSLER